MIYAFTGRGLSVTEELQEYAEKRFMHTAKIIGVQKIEPLLQCDLELHTGESGARYAARCALDVGGNLLHVEAHGETLHEAIDAASKMLAAEAGKAKGKRLGERRSASKIKDFLRGFRR